MREFQKFLFREIETLIIAAAETILMKWKIVERIILTQLTDLQLIGQC